MYFGSVIEGLQESDCYTRKSWNNPEVFIRQLPGDQDGKFAGSYISIQISPGVTRVWVPSPRDIFAQDWERVQLPPENPRMFDSDSSITFGEAILLLKDGYKVTRKGWNGNGMYLELQVPDAHSKMSRPYIYMKTVDDELVPWVASQSDILVNDWDWIPK